MKVHEIDINLCDIIENLLKSSRNISSYVSGENSIVDNMYAFVNMTKTENEVRSCENIINCVGKVNKELDKMLDVIKELMDIQDKITKNNKTYLSEIFSKGDDLK